MHFKIMSLTWSYSHVMNYVLEVILELITMLYYTIKGALTKKTSKL